MEPPHGGPPHGAPPTPHDRYRYAFVDIFETEDGVGLWWVSVSTFAVVTGMLLGLQEIAVAMSNPFGDDATDFDTRTLCRDATDNAIAYLTMAARYETPKAYHLMGNEEGIVNPLLGVKSFRLTSDEASMASVSGEEPPPSGTGAQKTNARKTMLYAPSRSGYTPMEA